MIHVDHYSDLLCVWAYVAQARMDELQKQFPSEIEINWHYLAVFGNVPGKLASQWGARGGVAGYAAHMREVAAGFEQVTVHADTWENVTPQSSAPAHLYLCAARVAASNGLLPADSEAKLGWAFRVAFFSDALDISAAAVLRKICIQQGLELSVLDKLLDSGSAYAAFCNDMQLARDANVRSSPTLIFNEDRQRLTGNVGYRIIEANVRELLERPQTQHSWC
jgi:predicted DsbA family dithiol-disulfide isomerase